MEVTIFQHDRCAFAQVNKVVGKTIQTTRQSCELVRRNMEKRSVYGCVVDSDVRYLDVTKELLNEDWIMEVVVRKGWILFLVFGVG
jgi:hypothetical protein